MANRGPAAKGAKGTADGFTEEERAAMREAVRERRARSRPGGSDPEQEVLAKIAAMQPSDRAMAERLHAIMKSNAPTLSSRTWYGMPAYANLAGDIVCFFQDAQKFKARYATIGFSDEANLDEGHMWPTVFALTRLTDVEEERIVALLRKALGRGPVTP